MTKQENLNSPEDGSQGTPEQNEESPDQKIAREMIEKAQDMKFKELVGFSLEVYRKIKDPKIQQETYGTLTELIEIKQKEELEGFKSKQQQAITDYKVGKITKEEMEDIVSPPVTKLGKKWREESRKKEK